MAYVKKTKKGTRRYKKKQPKASINRNMVSLGQGFPKQLKMTHRYADLITLTSTAGSQDNYLYRTNGMYDTDFTASGHQPMYFDQLTALYDHYTVIGSKIKLKIMSDSVVQGGSQVGIFINDDITVTQTLASGSLLENSSAHNVLIPAGSSGFYTKELYWSAPKAFRMKGSLVSASQFQGTSTSDPAEAQFFSIAMRGVGGASTIVNFQVEIEFIAVWTELKDIAGS